MKIEKVQPNGKKAWVTLGPVARLGGVVITDFAKDVPLPKARKPTAKGLPTPIVVPGINRAVQELKRDGQ